MKIKVNYFFSLLFCFLFSCISEKNRVSLESEGQMLPVRDNHFYYIPDYEVYYYPPTQQYISYDPKVKEWIYTPLAPPILHGVNLKVVHLVPLDYEGTTPYQYHETWKIKYPAKDHYVKGNLNDTLNYVRPGEHKVIQKNSGNYSKKKNTKTNKTPKKKKVK
jgi:hypothetical protein